MSYNQNKIVEASFTISDVVNDKKLFVEYEEIEYKVLKDLIETLEFLGYQILQFTMYE